jgi:hypothetical protein
MSSLSDTVSFTWDTAGSKVITVTAANVGGEVSNTHTITIHVLAITGPTTGYVRFNYTFTATISPSTTVPTTYTWQAIEPSVMNTTTLDNVVSFTWHTAGSKTITVTATNTIGTVTDTHTIVIYPSYIIYLPVLLK